jgi:hypothetical protein
LGAAYLTLGGGDLELALDEGELIEVSYGEE